jgi:transcriptional regulator of acetoin/glycerol metabolism
VDLLCPPSPPAAERVTPQDERQETLEALERAGWHRTAAANALGISRVTLWKRMRRHGLIDRDRAN